MVLKLLLFLYILGRIKCMKECELHCPKEEKLCRCTDPGPKPKSLKGLFYDSKAQRPCYDGYVYSCSIDGKCKQCSKGIE